MAQQTILITGANRGIGKALTAQFAKSGWHVLAAARDASKIEATPNVEPVTLDVTDQTSVDALALTLKGRTIDVLLNNAGVYGGDHQTWNDMDFGAFAETLQVNTIAPLRVAQAFVPHLETSPAAKIITISSQMGALQMRGTGAYAYRASKAAVNKVMQVLAQDLAAKDITVALFHPGWVRTDMGGSNADISPEESAVGIFNTVLKLTLQDTGKFFAWNGKEHVW
jgi:NAD(P)-dependent dehydrogenase (short-subunit alcohol dehydrogenase family)